MDEEKKPAWAECGKCGNRHIFAYTPMEAMKMVKVMHRLSCPMCGNTDTDKFYLCADPALEDKNGG